MKIKNLTYAKRIFSVFAEIVSFAALIALIFFLVALFKVLFWGYEPIARTAFTATLAISGAVSSLTYFSEMIKKFSLRKILYCLGMLCYSAYYALVWYGELGPILFIIQKLLTILAIFLMLAFIALFMIEKTLLVVEKIHKRRMKQDECATAEISD